MHSAPFFKTKRSSILPKVKTKQIQDDLYDGLDAEVTEGTEILLSRGWDANDVLGEALVGGMKIVGIDFRDGILFVPEVLKCAGAMKGGMKIPFKS